MIAPEISPGIPEVPVVNDVFIVPRKVPRVVRHYRNDRPDYRRAKYAGDSRTDAGCPETYQARNPAQPAASGGRPGADAGERSNMSVTSAFTPRIGDAESLPEAG
jgi:hypothetical protein